MMPIYGAVHYKPLKSFDKSRAYSFDFGLTPVAIIL